MNSFISHTLESAPEESKQLLQQALKDYGMLPELHQIMASSPELLKSYLSLHELFDKTDLSTSEKNIVWLVISIENECHYCVPAHTAIAKQQGVDDKVIKALRKNRVLLDPKLEALRLMTKNLVRHGGKATQDELRAFFAAGFKQRHVLDILVGVAQKTLSNFTNHLADTAVDALFMAYAWDSEGNN